MLFVTLIPVCECFLITWSCTPCSDSNYSFFLSSSLFFVIYLLICTNSFSPLLFSPFFSSPLLLLFSFLPSVPQGWRGPSFHHRGCGRMLPYISQVRIMGIMKERGEEGVRGLKSVWGRQTDRQTVRHGLGVVKEAITGMHDYSLEDYSFILLCLTLTHLSLLGLFILLLSDPDSDT